MKAVNRPLRLKQPRRMRTLGDAVASIVFEWSQLFPSPVTGRSYHASPIQQDWIRRAGWCLVECPNCGAVPGIACLLEQKNRGKRVAIPVHDDRRKLAIEMGFGSIGWHTFRHTYRSLLIKVKAQPEVQKTSCGMPTCQRLTNTEGPRWRKGGNQTPTSCG